MKTTEERAAEYAGSEKSVWRGCQYWRSTGYLKGCKEQLEIDKDKVAAFWEREVVEPMPDDEKEWAREKLQELLDVLDGE